MRTEFTPYLRLDERDAGRSYFDIREASVSYRLKDWEILGGISQIFWGVNESRNPVDIINQFDTVEDIDEEEKLGQPLIRVSHRSHWGTIEAYYLPYFRERRFASQEGRLRFPFEINESARFERNGDNTAGDIALRYSKRFGDFDLGLHAFQGTSRNPFFLFEQGGTATPVYQALRQAGLDVQYTKGPWLLKAEIVSAEITSHFWSIVSGFEYTFFNIKQSNIDIGLIGEYLFDNRDQMVDPINIFDDDFFLGTRITLNDVQDTEFLAGIIVDDNTGGTQGSVEFQRRIGNRILLELEARFFDDSGDALLSAFETDDVLQARVTFYF